MAGEGGTSDKVIDILGVCVEGPYQPIKCREGLPMEPIWNLRVRRTIPTKQEYHRPIFL